MQIKSNLSRQRLLGVALSVSFLMTFFMLRDLSAQVQVSGGVDFVSKYIWRGFNLAGVSHIDFSVSTELGLGGFTVSPRAVYVVAPESSVNPDNEFYVGLSLNR